MTSSAACSLFCFLLSLLSFRTMSEPYHMTTYYCEEPDFARNSSYGSNRDIVLSTLRDRSSLGSYSNTTTGLSPNTVYGMFLCRGDINRPSCSDCVQRATLEMAKNCTSKEGVIFYEECMVRYSDFSFFKLEEDTFSTSVHSLIPLMNSTQFLKETLREKIIDLIPRASLSTPIPYFVEDQERVNHLGRSFDLKAIVQCSHDLDPRNCTICLRRASQDISGCCPYNQIIWAQIFLPKCLVHYNISGFKPDELESPGEVVPPDVEVSLGFTKGNGISGRTLMAILTVLVLALTGL